MTIKRKSAFAILAFMLLFLLTASLLLSIKDGKFDYVVLILGALACVVILLEYNLLRALFKHLDRFVLLIATFLWSIGLVVLYRIDPETAMKQFLFIIVGSIIMIATMFIMKRSHDFGKLNWVFMGICIALLASSLILGETTSGAKNWIDLKFISIQPSEFAKILFIIISAYFFATRERIVSFIPYGIFTAACVLILVAARDLGAALLFSGTFLVMFFTGTGRILWTIGGIGVFAGGALVSYKLFGHVRDRVAIWQDPWANYHGAGYQIVQGLIALASGGLLGTGLGLGYPSAIPANHTDYIFTVICEEFGIVAGIIIIAFYLVFVVRGLLIALNARNKFDAILVFGCTAMLALQTFIIIGGVIKLIPLTGITMPFVSYGGSSMLSSMIQLGIIEGIAIKNGQRDEEELVQMGGEVL